MNNQEKYDLVCFIGKECIQEDELRNLFENPIAYNGFEECILVNVYWSMYITSN